MLKVLALIVAILYAIYFLILSCFVLTANDIRDSIISLFVDLNHRVIIMQSLLHSRNTDRIIIIIIIYMDIIIFYMDN